MHSCANTRTRCSLSELPAYLTQIRRTLNATKIFFHFLWHYFFSLVFMWITHCQVSIAVTSVSTYSCTPKRIEGQHLFMLFVFRLVHVSFHVPFDISFWLAAFDSSLLCLNLLPFLFIFSPGLYLWSVKLRVILVCTSVLVATGCWYTGTVKPPTGRLSLHQSDWKGVTTLTSSYIIIS